MKGVSPDDLVRMIRGLEAIKKLELPAVQPDLLIDRLESQGTKAAMTKAKKPRRKRDHWKTKQRKQRERMRPYMAKKYREELMPRRKRLAEDGMWWEYYVMEWKKRGLKIEVSRDEWESEVAGCIGQENVPMIFRFNTAKPVRLENIIIKDVDTKQVLFDGQEWMLKKLGAVEC